MHITILTFEGFNELDSLVAFGILNRVKKPGWRVSIACPSLRVRSMNGVVLDAQASLHDASRADVVLVGSGILTRDIVKDESLMAELRFDSTRQLLGAQCSGTLVLAKLGLLEGISACTDLTTKPWVEEAGVAVLHQPFFARDNIATAGGCLASQYLAAWVLARLEGVEAARNALHYVAPVGEKDDYVARAMSHISPYLVPNMALPKTHDGAPLQMKDSDSAGPYDKIPDVRDGLTREERVVLYVLHETQKERGGRNVPTVMLWGRVCEHFYISPEDLSLMLARLGARRD